MKNQLKIKPQDTWNDPKRKPHRVYKFKLPTFKASEKIIFLNKVHTVNNETVVYGLINSNNFDDNVIEYETKWKEVDLKEKQTLVLPLGSSIVATFVSENGEKPPNYGGDDDDDGDDDGTVFDDSIKTTTRLYVLTIQPKDEDGLEENTLYIQGTGHNLFTTNFSYIDTIVFEGKYVHHVLLDNDYNQIKYIKKPVTQPSNTAQQSTLPTQKKAPTPAYSDKLKMYITKYIKAQGKGNLQDIVKKIDKQMETLSGLIDKEGAMILIAKHDNIDFTKITVTQDEIDTIFS